MIEYMPYLESVDVIAKLGTSFVIITDENLKNKYGKQLAEKLDNTLLVAIPPGEESKTRDVKAGIEDAMLNELMGRDTVVIALGGGVITDIAGFVAATYCRGIPFVSIPTSLLAMVDAAIGGKTGVNTLHGKNMIGAFYNPTFLIYDLSLLLSLPDEEMLSGLAEVIKYGAICDETLFVLIERNKMAWDAKDSSLLEALISHSVMHKNAVVEADAKESGMRRILNFGHTIGHALEKTMDYALSHGNAVAIGMLAEARLANLLGHLDDFSYERIKEVIDLYKFPLHISATANELIDAMRLDKKSAEKTPRFTLLSGIGSHLKSDGAYCESVPEHTLRVVLAEMIDGEL
jgi:3-dehydroquinate synthase